MESAHLVYLIASKIGKFSQAIRDHTKYQPIDDESVNRLCEIASIEISAMVNNNETNGDFVKRWSDKGFTKQIDLLANITGIDFAVCERLLIEHHSLVAIFKSDFSTIVSELNASDLEKLGIFF